MVITYRNISFNIEYPVFLLPSSDWETRDGLLLIDNRIVDDKNKEGRTLGARRMQTAHKDVLPLKKMLTSYNGILKQTTKCFIDNVGKPFIYEKTKFADLKYLQIKGVERKTFATLITVKGHTLAFTYMGFRGCFMSIRKRNSRILKEKFNLWLKETVH
jgi:hypothetical protein